jgi:3-carboxy-cis,cis-muconate cycloisomerase
MVAAAKLLRDRASSMLDAMMQDFERATGPWHLEWATVPETFLLTASSLHQAEFMLNGLDVHPERMRSNTRLTGGLIVAEAVMMAVAPSFGRQRAHDIVYDACRQAIERGSDLATELQRHGELVALLGEEGIDALCDPTGYLGSARAMTMSIVNS